MEYKAWKRAYKKHLNTAFICLICFGQVIPCSIITGCSKNFEGTKQEETSKKILAANEKISPGGSSGSSTATLVPTTAPTLLLTRAATKIQAAVRGAEAQRLAKEAREEEREKQAEAERQQKAARRQEEARKEQAATTIQALARRHLARKDFVEKKQAVTKIQAAVRTHNAKLVEGKNAAAKLQTAYRKHLARKEFVENKQAATNIQTAARRHLAKQNLAEQKQAPTSNSKGIQAKTSPENMTQSWEHNVGNEFSSNQGQDLLGKIFGGKKIERAEDTEQTTMAGIMNFLYQKAQEKEQAFTEGTYIIEDPGQRFFNFLEKLAESYTRISSHSIGSEQSRHYGFDMQEGSFQPRDKRHILFFSTKQDGKNKLFLKPENYGTKEWGDFIKHSVEYVESFAKRYGIIDATHHDDQGACRKERPKYLNDTIKEACQKCIVLIGDSHLETDDASLTGSGYLMAETQAKANKEFQEQGIAFLITKLKCKHFRQSNELKTHLESLEKALESYNLDHADKRVAQEVIFTQEELIRP